MDAALLERWDDPQNASGLSRLELICGWVSGVDARGPDIAEFDPLPDPRDALERALRDLLQQDPCCIAFSGGRDSSVLLAAATRVARREGLRDPIAITMRWGAVKESQEASWQEEVMRHLGLQDWQIVDADQDMDLLGEVASATLRDHGLLWPPAAHGMLPLQRAATGGVLVSGDGGDQVFGGWRRADVADLLARRRRVTWRDLPRLALVASPTPVRAQVEARRGEFPAPWLTPTAMNTWRRHRGRALAEEPRTWAPFLRWTRRERATVLMLETWSRLGDSVGSTFAAPFWDPVFLRSLGAWGGRLGRGRRTPLMRALFGGLLPDSLLSRRTKARFTHAYFSATSRRFAETWQGPAPESSSVMQRPLREAWLSEFPPTTSAPLLQAAWLQHARVAGPCAGEDRCYSS